MRNVNHEWEVDLDAPEGPMATLDLGGHDNATIQVQEGELVIRISPPADWSPRVPIAVLERLLAAR